jgi:hypothetical protein
MAYDDNMAPQSSTTSHTGENEIKPANQDSFLVDVEQKMLDDCHLMNDVVRNYCWQGVKVVVKDHETKAPKAILQDISGVVEAGIWRREKSVT